MHKANIGLTGSGKTFQAIVEAKRSGKSVLYINPQDEDITGFVRVDGTAEFSTISRILAKGLPVSYVPHRDKKIALRELDYLVQKVFDRGHLNVIIDETGIHGEEGMSSSPWIDIAERGRKREVWGTFLMQDPAGVAKRILRNCTQMRVFDFNEYSVQYFARLGYNVEEMQAKLLESGQYSYIIIERGQMVGIGRE